MSHPKATYLDIILLIAASLACSISSIQQQAQSAKQTANALRTDISGIAAVGGSLIKTAQALETSHPGVLETVKAIATQGVPILSTLKAVSTYSPGLVQTAQAVIQQEIPTGEPPPDIPLLASEQLQNYFGSSQYIFYISPTPYSQVLQFYKTEMTNNGWQFVQDNSHEYANAAQLVYSKDNRTASINLSLNPLNNTSVVVINLSTH